MNRRSFLGAAAFLALAARCPKPELELGPPTLWGDGIHDDTAALQAIIDGRPVRYHGVLIGGGNLCITNAPLRVDGVLTLTGRPAGICRAVPPEVAPPPAGRST